MLSNRHIWEKQNTYSNEGPRATQITKESALNREVNDTNANKQIYDKIKKNTDQFHLFTSFFKITL